MLAKDVRKFLFDLFQDVFREQYHYKFHYKVREAIRTKDVTYPLEKLRSYLLGQGRTEDVITFIEKRSYRGEDSIANQIIIKYFKSLEVPEVENDAFYPPLEFWVEPTEVTRELDEYVLNPKRSSTRPVVYIGEKGSGKTHTIHCWLFKNRQKFNQRKILWVYANGHELYQIWRGYEKYEPNLVTIEEFFKLRLIYIIAKYHTHNAFLREIHDQLMRCSKRTFYIGKSGSSYQEDTVRLALKTFEEHIRSYEATRRYYRGVEAKYYSYVLRESQRGRVNFDKAKQRWLALARSVEEFLFEHGYTILKILDGMDNINIEAQTTMVSLYKFAIKQAANFLLSESDRIIKILVTRERTYIDIMREPTVPPGYSGTGMTDLPYEIGQPPQDMVRIYERRMRFVLSLTGEEAKSDLVSFLRKGVICYQEHLNAISDNKKTLSDWYHNNVSNFLHNVFTLFLLLYYRWLQQGKPDLSIYNIGKQLREYFPRNLFLNGRFFLDSRKHQNRSKIGEFAFSPFYVEEDFVKQNPSNILIHLRVLQLLDQERELPEEEAIDILNTLGHDHDLIVQSIELCREYGLVDTKVSARHQHKIYVKTTAKGKALLDLIFSNLDLLYLFALDTYVPSYFVSEEFIQPFNNKLLPTEEPIKTKYAIGAIKTATVFLIYLLHLNELDALKFANVSEIDYISTVLSLPLSPKHMLRLAKRFEQLYERCTSEERKELRTFFDMLRG